MIHSENSKMNKQAIIIGLALVCSTILVTNNNYAYSVKCEDIKGVEKWDPEGHDDNNPSEKKFLKVLEEKTFCEVNEMIDHEEIEGEIQEDTKHDLDWLKGTIYYQSVDEEAQECIDDAYEDSPDDNGKDNAADYELLECTY